MLEKGSELGMSERELTSSAVAMRGRRKAGLTGELSSTPLLPSLSPCAHLRFVLVLVVLKGSRTGLTIFLGVADSCSLSRHIHDGEFMGKLRRDFLFRPSAHCFLSDFFPSFALDNQAKFPLIPGHESVGVVEALGANVKGFAIGDRCVADVGEVSTRPRTTKEREDS